MNMRTDTISFLAICYLAFIFYVAFGCVCAWPQQIPLEYDLDGMSEQASKHNFVVLSASDATVSDATITNATFPTEFNLQGFAWELIGGASGEILVIDDATQVVPGDINTLLNFSQLPAFAVLSATGQLISATASDGVLYVTGAGGILIDVTESDAIMSIGDIGGYVPRDAYSIFAVADGTAEATAFVSQFHLSAADNVDLNLDTVARSLTISATVVGSGNGVFTTIVAATDSLNKVSADWQCDGTNDTYEMTQAQNYVRDLGGTIYMMEGAYSPGYIWNVTSRNIAVRGSGWSTVLNQDFSGIQWRGYYAKATNLEMRDMTFQGKGGTYAAEGNEAIYLDSGCYLTSLHDLRIQGYGDKGIEIAGAPGHLLWLYNNLVARTGGAHSYRSGIYQSGQGPESIIKDNFLYDNYYSGFNWFGAGYPARVFISNIMYSNSGVGLSTNFGNTCYGNICVQEDYTSFISPANSPVAGNLSYSAGDTGIDLAERSLVYGNYVGESAGVSMFSDTNTDESLVSGNLIYLGAQEGIYCYNANDSPLWGSNAVLNQGDSGLLMYAVGAYAMADGNYVSNNATEGIYVGYSYGGAGWFVMVSNNIVLNNGSTGSTDAIWLRGGGYPYVLINGKWVVDNYIYDSVGTGSAIDVGSHPDATLEGNYIRGKFGTNVIDGAGFAGSDKWRDVAQMIYPCTSSVYVLESSAPVLIGLATRTEVTSPLTVGSNASTNPIATSWDLISDPGLKENILVWKDRGKEIESLRKMRNCEIEFEYALQEKPERKLGWDLSSPEFPEHLKSYGYRGKPIGIRTSQLLADLYAAADYLSTETKRLREEVALLRERR